MPSKDHPATKHKHVVGTRHRTGNGEVNDVISKTRSFPQVDRADFQSIPLSRLISPVNGVRFRPGKKWCVSNATDFDQAQYLKSAILPFNSPKERRESVQ